MRLPTAVEVRGQRVPARRKRGDGAGFEAGPGSNCRACQRAQCNGDVLSERHDARASAGSFAGSRGSCGRTAKGSGAAEERGFFRRVGRFFKRVFGAE